MFGHDSDATVYERPTGVICYEVEFLRSQHYHAGEPDSNDARLSFLQRLLNLFPGRVAIFPPAEFRGTRDAWHISMALAKKNAIDHSKIECIPESLIATGLAWWWESSPDRPQDVPVREWQTGVFAPSRDWTLLVDENRQSLAHDIAEYDFLDSRGRSITLIGFEASGSPAAIEADWIKGQLRKFCFDETGPIRIVIWNPGDGPFDYFFVPHDPPSAVREMLSSLGLDGSRKLCRRTYSGLRGARLERIYGLVQ